MKSAILIFALLAATGAQAQNTTNDQICVPPATRNSVGKCEVGQVLLDLNQLSQPLMMCYMERFNERRLCALLGGTPGCVKWLAEHPDPSKDRFE